MMTATQQEKERYGSQVEIARRDAHCTVYRIANADGDVVMTSYPVFSGIELIYNDVHTQECSIERADIGDIVEINHCREGRIECQFRDEFFYLAQGDVSISRKRDAGHDSYFPGSHYHGISIMIDLNDAPDMLSNLLEGVNVQLTDLVHRYCDGEACFVLRKKDCLERIFQELYTVPEAIRSGYFRVKLLELLLVLNSMEVTADIPRQQTVPRTQVSLAKAVCRELCAHLDKKITINQLAEQFHVSETYLKNSFKRVYGTSVYAFVRTQKMREAALRLRKSDETVLEIAGSFGYDNGSKFAKAFRDVIGMTPSEYRAEQKMIFSVD